MDAREPSRRRFSEASAPEMPRAAILAATPKMVLTVAEIAEYLRQAASPI
jgi:hypothetical protein